MMRLTEGRGGRPCQAAQGNSMTLGQKHDSINVSFLAPYS